MKEKKLTIQSNIIWNSVGSFIYLITQWLIGVLVVRIAGVDTAGKLTLAMSVNNVFYSIAIQGIRNYQVSDVKEKYTAGTYVSSRLISCFIALSVCIGYCLIIEYSGEQKNCIIAYCLFKMSEALYDVYAGICQKSWRMDYIGKSWIIRGVLTFSGFLSVLYLCSSLFFAIVCMAGLSFGVILFYDIPKAKGLADIEIKCIDKQNLLLIQECFPLFCYLVLSAVIPTIPRIFLERVWGSYALGIYGSIATPTLIVQMGASYIFNPFMTLFAEQYETGQIKEFRKTLKKCLSAIGALSVVALFGGKLLGRWGLELLYGKEVASYTYLLLPLILCTILTAIVWFLCALLTIVRELWTLVVCNLLVLPISLIGSGICLKQFGIQGASVILCISLVIEIVCLWIFLMKKLDNQKKSVEGVKKIV